MKANVGYVELWQQGGRGAVDSWNDVLDLRRRADGTFRLRLERVGVEEDYRWSVYCSRPFRSPERFLKELQQPANYYMPAHSLPQLLTVVAQLVTFDADFGRRVLLTLAAQLQMDAGSRDHAG